MGRYCKPLEVYLHRNSSDLPFVIVELANCRSILSGLLILQHARSILTGTVPPVPYRTAVAQHTPFKLTPSTRIERLAASPRLCAPPPSLEHSGAPPAAPSGAAFGPTSSDAVSEHGHGHHLFQTESETGAAVARSRADLAGEASCMDGS